MKRTTPAIALLASAVVLAIAGCGSSTDNDSASTTANRQAAAGKLAYRAYGSRIDVQGGASGVEWPCKNVGALAADAQYVYFTNADGIGRTRWDGSGSANCNFSTQPATAITAAAGKVAELSGSRVDVIKGASDIAWPCKNVGALAADTQYVYFTNADGIGRTRWDGSGSANCNFSTQPATAITAAAGKVAELSGSRVDVVKGASDIAWPCKGVGQLAADTQYVYFTNDDGIGRTRWDGSGSANCRYAAGAGNKPLAVAVAP